jgi:hypothetical protein
MSSKANGCSPSEHDVTTSGRQAAGRGYANRFEAGTHVVRSQVASAGVVGKQRVELAVDEGSGGEYG